MKYKNKEIVMVLKTGKPEYRKIEKYIPLIQKIAMEIIIVKTNNI